MIHNAIRFAPEGRSIPVTAQLAPSGVEVHIDDESPGIAEGNQRMIFERFSRLSADQTGASLGLAITKWIVEEHGGEIFVSGNPLGGSRFTVLLPKNPPLVLQRAICMSEQRARSGVVPYCEYRVAIVIVVSERHWRIGFTSLRDHFAANVMRDAAFKGDKHRRSVGPRFLG